MLLYHIPELYISLQYIKFLAFFQKIYVNAGVSRGVFWISHRGGVRFKIYTNLNTPLRVSLMKILKVFWVLLSYLS